MAGVRAMPNLVPTTPDDPATEANRAAWQQLAAWDKPFLVAFSDGDPITGAMGPVLRDTVPGARGHRAPGPRPGPATSCRKTRVTSSPP